MEARLTKECAVNTVLDHDLPLFKRFRCHKKVGLSKVNFAVVIHSKHAQDPDVPWSFWSLLIRG